ncbi:hypothetical protein Syun_021051 [Stephania yunnanensis]|uniref:Uncharacterized protein n=1 Tax=Stephania yunnanensis TaxID=152371 RepID=A0AAP0IEZ0_9MAGN
MGFKPISSSPSTRLPISYLSITSSLPSLSYISLCSILSYNSSHFALFFWLSPSLFLSLCALYFSRTVIKRRNLITVEVHPFAYHFLMLWLVLFRIK